jgi:LPXTG-site transpeptidase (sortase) family protein
VILRRALAGTLVLLGLLLAAATAVMLARPGLLQPLVVPVLPSAQTTAGPPDSRGEGEPIGIIEVPRLKISSVVLEGEDRATLLLGVGHLADTPYPWNGGNSVLAAHRDTFFRPLAHVRANDIIRFRTADAEFDYRVRETKIVEPTDLEVLAPTRTSTMTLITCYPFGYIGAAPRRFVVVADRIPPTPSSSETTG